jgi:hypothetical protein
MIDFNLPLGLPESYSGRAGLAIGLVRIQVDFNFNLLIINTDMDNVRIIQVHVPPSSAISRPQMVGYLQTTLYSVIPGGKATS